MGSLHIGCDKSEVANVILMPGDPLRAKFIAENFLTDVKQITGIRNALGYTGFTKNGKRITVMSSGMGMPSMGIYSHELFQYYDVDVIVRVGTCGCYDASINLMDIILTTSSSTDSSWGKQYGVNGTLSAAADFDLTRAAVKAAKELEYPFRTGQILSSDVFYDYDPVSWKKWASLGVLGVEMESYALLLTAQVMKKKALCILTVTDHFVTGERVSTEQRQEGLVRMIEVGIKTVEKFAR